MSRADDPATDTPAELTRDARTYDDAVGDDVMAALSGRATLRNRARVDELAGLAERLDDQGGFDAAELGRVRQLGHELVGSAGTFGHPEVSELAIVLNRVLTREQHLGPSERSARARTLIERIRTLLSAG